LCFNKAAILVVASSLAQNKTNKQKLILPPKEGEKKSAFGVCATSSHWLSSIVIPKCVPHHFSPRLMIGVGSMGVYSLFHISFSK
jgi:hypothetical protein